MIIATTRPELAEARDRLGGTVGVVMTMGALHAGHEALIRAARERADQVLVTIFVNPLQFGPAEDFDRYPRTLDRDLAICARTGVDVVFTPTRDEIYPDGEPAVWVCPGPVGEILEGASRPGFFHGVLTVVLKLLHLTRPDLAFFGEKDYQQLTLIRRMVRDTDLPVEIVGVPTVREPDGLALSSRNRYLSDAERQAALSLSAALRAGPDLAKARAALDPAVDLDYLVLTDPDLGPAPERGPARLLIAAWVGGRSGSPGEAPGARTAGATRLIDNLAVEL